MAEVGAGFYERSKLEVKMIKKEMLRMSISELVPYERNPRKIPQSAIDDVRESIRQCGALDPIEVDENNVILAGHTRRLAYIDEGIDVVDVVRYTGLTEEQKRKYRLLSNKTGEKSSWDYELLNWELEDLDFEGYDFGFDVEEWEDKYSDAKAGSLADKYITPPFSVLDARGGDWQKRKDQWLKIVDSGLGRDENLLGGGLNKLGKAANKNTRMTGTSIFDPVLCETLLAWFCPEFGSIIDPFAGGSVRGLVSSYTGRKYTGIDLSQRQIDANNEGFERLEKKEDFFGGVLEKPNWVCGDSADILTLAPGEYDFMLTCPPYADLEKYSDDKRDLSNMSYADFRRVYADIIAKTVSLLKKDAFAAIVVGEVRDKNGYYYNFVSDTIDAFTKAGMKYYNECILVTAVGTGALRANRTFGTTRKVVKSHQNVLIFSKGEPRNIKLGEYTYDFEEDDIDV